MKVCFVTSLFSDNYKISDKPIKFKKNEDYDYYLFTNLDKNKFDTSWEIVNIFNDEKILCNIKHNVIRSRYPKFMFWQYLKEVMKKKYDVVFYCDCILYPNSDVNWKKYGDIILKSESGIIQSLHFLNNTPYDECDFIFKERKETEENMIKMKTFLEDNKLPKKSKMMENYSFGYDPNNTKITNAFLDFWKEYSKHEITYRDQPFWGYYMWKHKIEPENVKEWRDIFKREIEMGFNSHTYV